MLRMRWFIVQLAKNEVAICLHHGTRVIKQSVEGEMYYGKQYAFKDKKIIVIYTYRNDEERIITVYPIKRKKQWTKTTP